MIIWSGIRRIGDNGIRYNYRMPLTIQEVEHIAKLARLELSEDEKNRYREQLSAILEHVAQLQKLDTSALRSLPGGGLSNAENPLRVDEARPGLPTETLLKSAAQTERSPYKIPPVFE